MPGIGRVWIASEGDAITDLTFDRMPFGAVEAETPATSQAAGQLSEYLAGTRRQFDLRLSPSGTPFQQRVWGALLEIPYGQTRTYKEIAAAIGNPAAARAVGMVNNRNPIAILIPCHRVIGANGALTGYAGGLPIKNHLLTLESRSTTSAATIRDQEVAG